MSYPLGSVEGDQRAEYYAEPGGRQSRPGFRLLATGIIALFAAVVFAGGLWFAYHQGMQHAGSSGGDVPLIRADARPTKVKPEKPGGMEVPDRDKLIYTQKRGGVEHLLPPPEKPMPRPVAGGAPALQPETSRPPTAVSATANSSAAPAAIAPGRPAGIAQVAAKPGATITAQSSPATANGMRLQLASVRNEAAAVQEWNRIKRANADLLGNVSATPVRVDLGDKGVFYRVLSGPIADAERVCRELNQRNVGCVIAH